MAAAIEGPPSLPHSFDPEQPSLLACPEEEPISLPFPEHLHRTKTCTPTKVFDAVPFIAAVAFLLFDIGWLMSWPTLFLIGGVPGMILQAACAVTSYRHHSGYEAWQQIAFLLWIAGNFVWAGCNMIYPPVGLFWDWSFTRNMEPRLNAPLMIASTIVVGIGVAILFVAHFQATRPETARDSEGNVLPRSSSSPPLMESHRASASRTLLGIVDHAEEDRVLAHRHVYLLPFMVADWLWCLGDLLQLYPINLWVFEFLAVVCVLLGIPCAVWGVRSVMEDHDEGMRSNAWMLGSDVVWVEGNMLWAVQDLLSAHLSPSTNSLLIGISLASFLIAGVGMVVSLSKSNKEGDGLALAGPFSVVSLSRRSSFVSNLASHSAAMLSIAEGVDDHHHPHQQQHHQQQQQLQQQLQHHHQFYHHHHRHHHHHHHQQQLQEQEPEQQHQQQQQQQHPPNSCNSNSSSNSSNSSSNNNDNSNNNKDNNNENKDKDNTNLAAERLLTPREMKATTAATPTTAAAATTTTATTTTTTTRATTAPTAAETTRASPVGRDRRPDEEEAPAEAPHEKKEEEEKEREGGAQKQHEKQGDCESSASAATHDLFLAETSSGGASTSDGNPPIAAVGLA